MNFKELNIHPFYGILKIPSARPIAIPSTRTYSRIVITKFTSLRSVNI